MQVVYGGFQLQRGCANLRVVRATRRSPQTNLPLVESETWIIEGFVRGSTTAELTVNMTSYESAFRVSGGDLKFVDANGSPTAHQLLSSSTVSGTRVDRFEWRRYRFVGRKHSDHRHGRPGRDLEACPVRSGSAANHPAAIQRHRYPAGVCSWADGLPEHPIPPV